MTKTKEPKNTGELSFLELDNLLSKIDPRGSLSTINAFSKIDDFIHTGNYLFNAQISGSLFGGIPNSRTTAFAGETGCVPKDQSIRIYKIKSNSYAKHNIELE